MTALERLKAWAKALKRDLIALWIAARDSRTPLAAKLTAAAVAAYAFSPIDLIPDVIPVLGYLDDLILVPAGVWLAIRLVPPPLMAEFRGRAGDIGERPTSRAGMIAIVALWVAAMAATAWLALG